MRATALALLVAALGTGCAAYFGIDAGSNATLAEPPRIPAAPDYSADFAAYRNFAVATDPTSFSETMMATDMGRWGVPQTVGAIPVRRIAARDIGTLVERHFRPPLPDERPAFVLETRPQFFSVRQDGRTAHVKVSIHIRCLRKGDAPRKLLSAIYTGERTGPWVAGQVPVAFYEAMNDIWSAFLRDFCTTVRPAAIMGESESETRLPELRGLTFASRRDNADVAVGQCAVVCNDFEAFQAAVWAKQRIFALCVEHLGIDEKRVRIRYDDELTRFDDATKTWHFAFSAWARTRMALQYDPASRRGCAIVDLGLFGGTAEKASEAARQFIVREMNLRAATYADDHAETKADIDFLSFETDAEDDLVIVRFRLVY